jgi:hypothetical protein
MPNNVVMTSSIVVFCAADTGISSSINENREWVNEGHVKRDVWNCLFSIHHLLVIVLSK